MQHRLNKAAPQNRSERVDKLVVSEIGQVKETLSDMLLSVTLGSVFGGLHVSKSLPSIRGFERIIDDLSSPAAGTTTLDVALVQ